MSTYGYELDRLPPVLLKALRAELGDAAETTYLLGGFAALAPVIKASPKLLAAYFAAPWGLLPWALLDLIKRTDIPLSITIDRELDLRSPQWRREE